MACYVMLSVANDVNNGCVLFRCTRFCVCWAVFTLYAVMSASLCHAKSLCVVWVTRTASYCWCSRCKQLYCMLQTQVHFSISLCKLPDFLILFVTTLTKYTLHFVWMFGRYSCGSHHTLKLHSSTFCLSKNIKKC